MSSAQPILFFIGIFLVGAVITQDDYCFRNSCNKMRYEDSQVSTRHNRIREEFISGNTPKVPHVSRKLTNTCCSDKMQSKQPSGKVSSKTQKQEGNKLRIKNQTTVIKIKGSKKKRKKLKRKKARKKNKEYRNKRLNRPEKRPARWIDKKDWRVFGVIYPKRVFNFGSREENIHPRSFHYATSDCPVCLLWCAGSKGIFHRSFFYESEASDDDIGWLVLKSFFFDKDYIKNIGCCIQ